MKMPRLLELFSGTKSISKVAKKLGWETVSLDIDPRFLDDTDLCMDIMLFDERQFPRNYFSCIYIHVLNHFVIHFRIRRNFYGW